MAAKKKSKTRTKRTKPPRPAAPARTGKKRRKASAGATHQVHRVLNVLPSKDTDKDWTVENAAGAGLTAAAAAPLPSSVDLRADWWAINDQASTGACVGWSTADSVIRWHFVTAQQIAQNKLLSPRFLWMASKETDEFTAQPTTFIETDGTSIKSALDIARKFGTVPDSMLPFRSGKLYPGEVKTFYALASQGKIKSYFNLKRDLAAWRRWLANNGPIAVRLDVDSTWETAPSTKGKLDVYKPATASGGHAVALVGYTPERFIVRNSWGTAWGDKGFAYASVAYATAAFTEAYGVTI